MAMDVTSEWSRNVMIQCALSGPAKTRAHIVKAPVSNPHFEAGFAIAQKQGESGKLTPNN